MHGFSASRNANSRNGLSRNGRFTNCQRYDIVRPMAKLRRTKSRKGMVVTSVALDGDLHRRLRVAAAETRIPLTAIVRTAVRAWLEAWERRRAKR